jgi:hypothetical protein
MANNFEAVKSGSGSSRCNGGAVANAFGSRNLIVDETWDLYHAVYPTPPHTRLPSNWKMSVVGMGVHRCNTSEQLGNCGGLSTLLGEAIRRLACRPIWYPQQPRALGRCVLSSTRDGGHLLRWNGPGPFHTRNKNHPKTWSSLIFLEPFDIGLIVNFHFVLSYRLNSQTMAKLEKA